MAAGDVFGSRYPGQQQCRPAARRAGGLGRVRSARGTRGELYSGGAIDQSLHSRNAARRFGRIVNITSAMVKSPHYVMGLSTSARAVLTGIYKAISVEVAADNVTINILLPERIDTPRQEFMARRMMSEQGIDRDEARRQIAMTLAAKMFGRPEGFGDACAFLCSSPAGFISGQNLQLDGGSYRGLI
jgi:3-oxoacyl-[acyl-carrier protein] reductase